MPRYLSEEVPENIRKAAEQADMIVNGYAFQQNADKLYVRNLNRIEKVLVLGKNDIVLITKMDDIEIQVVLRNLKRNRKFLKGS